MREKSLLLSIVVVFSLGAFAPAVSPEARAAYPDKPIRLIVPFPAGGNTDIVSRAIGNELSKNLGVSVVIKNAAEPGAWWVRKWWPKRRRTVTRF